MRIRWRGLELPGRVVRDEAVSTDRYGRFTIEPFEQGFGTTIGNSLRRVLLSSLEGAAVTSVKIDGVAHEFASIDGIQEDVTDIILNVKGIIVRFEDEGTKVMSIERKTAGEIRAGDFETDPAVTILNPDHIIATLTDDVTFKAELVVRSGRGYATAVENRSPDQELGLISIDSTFSPVQRVRYRTEDMRVGQRTNYDRLILEIWTDGTVSPENALIDGGLILRKHLNPFVFCQDMGEETVAIHEIITTESQESTENPFEALLESPVSRLNLSVRALNCLDIARITTVRELVSQTENDLLRFRSFGKTSLQEVQSKLRDAGLSLGMKSSIEGGIADGVTVASMPFVQHNSPEGGTAVPHAPAIGIEESSSIQREGTDSHQGPPSPAGGPGGLSVPGSDPMAAYSVDE